LISKLPKWTPEAIEDDFQSSVAMRYSRDSKKSDIAQFSAKDFYRYEDWFLKFLDRTYLYWEDFPPQDSFKTQKDLFINGAQPRAFKNLLEKCRKVIKNLDHLHQAVHSIVDFVGNTLPCIYREVNNRQSRPFSKQELSTAVSSSAADSSVSPT
jgi:predicted KAP-like P-loop ATPase